MKKGLELFYTSSESKIKDVYDFPPLFTKFLSLYKLGEDKLNIEKYKNEHTDFLVPLSSVVYRRENEEIGVDFFFDIDELIYTRRFEEDNFIKIGILHYPPDEGIYLGTKGDARDGIFVRDWSISGNINQYTKLEDDIFSFAKKLVSIPNRHQLTKEMKNNLYKKWNEDFWRVRSNLK